MTTPMKENNGRNKLLQVMWYWYGMVHDLGQEFLVPREVHRLVKSSCKIFFYSKEKTICMKLHFTKL
jgi:hypothetical protein